MRLQISFFIGSDLSAKNPLDFTVSPIYLLHRSVLFADIVEINMIFVTYQYNTLQMMDNCLPVRASRTQTGAISATAQMSFIRANGHVCPESGINLAVFTGNDKNIIGGFKMRR